MIFSTEVSAPVYGIHCDFINLIVEDERFNRYYLNITLGYKMILRVSGIERITGMC